MEKSDAARSAERHGKIGRRERAIPPLSSPAAASATATKQASAGLFGTVQQQASMIACADVFFLLSIMFAACLSLILLMKKATKGGGRSWRDGALVVVNLIYNPAFKSHSII